MYSAHDLEAQDFVFLNIALRAPVEYLRHLLSHAL